MKGQIEARRGTGRHSAPALNGAGLPNIPKVAEGGGLESSIGMDHILEVGVLARIFFGTVVIFTEVSWIFCVEFV